MTLFNKYSLLILRSIILLAYMLLSYRAYLDATALPAYIDIIFLLFFIDVNNILSLKNYISVYIVLVFKLSAWFWFPDKYILPFDGSAYLCSFLLGYEIKKILWPNKAFSTPEKQDYARGTENLKFLIKLFVGLKLLHVVFLVAVYGFSSVYSGQMLVDRTYNYGRKSTVDGLLIIYSFFVDTFLVALAVLYVKYIAAQGKKPDYYYLSMILLLMPLLVLSRSGFAFGILTILCIYGYFSKNRTKVYLYILPVFVVLFAVSFYIGTLRMSKYTSGEDFSDITAGDQFFVELTPIIAYNTVRENIKILDYQYGKTIILPLLLKPIPRGFWPEKPNNSSAYYAKEFDYNNFNSGFAMPLTLFGDLFINFGIFFTCMLTMLIGGFIARFDLIYLNKDFRHIDTYLIFFICFYSLIRNNLPESLIGILLMVFAKKFIEMVILKHSAKEI